MQFLKAILAGLVLLLSLVSASAEENAPRGFVALAYHNVEDADPDQAFLGITTERLIAQLSWLQRNGYRPVTVDAIVAARDGGQALPEKAVLLTFDDGYASFYSRVLPVLRAFEFPAVLALVGAWMESTSTVQFGDRRVDRSQFLSWDQVREIVATGLVEIASHSYDLHRGTVANPQGNSEPDITSRSFDPASGIYETDAKQRRDLELDSAKMVATIRRETGRHPRVMVWPYGEHGLNSISIASASGLPITFTLVDGSAQVDRLSAVSRHLVSPDPSLGQFVSEIRKIDTISPERVVHVDLDYVYDDDPAQLARNLDRLVQRIFDMRISTVFLQAFADPGGSGLAKSVYFPNRVLPMRADLFDRVSWQLRTRARVKVYAWMPVLAFDFGDLVSPVVAWNPASGLVAVDPKAYRRASPFDPEARRRIRTLYEDLARFTPFEGLLFHDDAQLSDFEDAGTAALAAYARAGFPGSIELIRADPDLMARWSRFKTDALLEFTQELAAIARRSHSPLSTARSLYAGPVLDPAAEAWFAQDLDRFLATYDYVAVMAMPAMENVPEADAHAWLRRLVGSVAARPLGLKRTIFELQAVDWRDRAGSGSSRIPTEVLAEQMRLLTRLGALNFGYYPDDFATGHPDAGALHRDFSLQSYPYPR